MLRWQWLTAHPVVQRPGGSSEDGSYIAPAHDPDLGTPIIASRHEQGIKRVGIIYSPRKSWWAGMVLMVLSVLIFIITIVTVVV